MLCWPKNGHRNACNLVMSSPMFRGSVEGYGLQHSPPRLKLLRIGLARGKVLSVHGSH